MKQFATCLDYQHTQPQEKTIPHNLPGKLWEIVGADIFSIDNETLFCIVDYYSKFPVMKRTDVLSADDLRRATKVTETFELFSLQNIRLLIDKLSFTTVNFIRSENKPSIAGTFMYLGTSEHML